MVLGGNGDSRIESQKIKRILLFLGSRITRSFAIQIYFHLLILLSNLIHWNKKEKNDLLITLKTVESYLKGVYSFDKYEKVFHNMI